MMEYDHLEIVSRIDHIALPWEIESFAELSLLSKEKSSINKSFNDPNNNEFSNDITTIRKFLHPYLKSQKGKPEFADAYMMVSGMLQFKPQANIIIRLYRYNYYWNYKSNELNMAQEFQTKYDNLSYSRFIELAFLIYFFASIKLEHSDTMLPIIFRHIAGSYMREIMQLMISRDDYIERQNDKNNADLNNIAYGFNYLFPYPFIEYQGLLFLPVPYLIIDAVTESLLTRFTNENSKSRELIGKYVAQDYLEKILKDSNKYDEVLPEIHYKKHKQRIDSPDVMICFENYVCFFDSKLSTPKLSLRQFNDDDINATTIKYAKNVIQLYNRIIDFLEGSFYPFENEIELQKNNMFGVVVLFEDSFIMKRKIYDTVFEILKIDNQSDTAQYICSHIKITDLQDIENISHKSFSIFDSLIYSCGNRGEWNNMSINNDEVYRNQTIEMSPDFKKFEKGLKDKYRDYVKQLKNDGLIS